MVRQYQQENVILKIDPDAEIAIYGQSMGAAATIHLCAELTENEPAIRKGGYSLYDAKAIDAVSRTDVPILFIQGLDDKIVSPDNVYKLYDEGTSEKDILTVEGAGHCQSYEKDPETYFNTLFDFTAG